MPLTDQYTGVVDRFGEAQFEDLSLQSSLQEILDLERKYVIQFHARLVKDTNTHETTDQGVSFEKTTGVSFYSSTPNTQTKNERRAKRTFESEKFTSSTTDLGERELHSPGMVSGDARWSGMRCSRQHTRFLVCCGDRILRQASIRRRDGLPRRVWTQRVSVCTG
jgi:hypothetical protein